MLWIIAYNLFLKNNYYKKQLKRGKTCNPSVDIRLKSETLTLQLALNESPRVFWNFPATLLLSCWQNMAMSALHHHFNATNNTRWPLTACRDAGRCHYTPARLPAKTSTGRWKHDIIHVPCVIEGSTMQVVCANQDSFPQQLPTCPLCRETAAHTSPAFSVPLSPTVETPPFDIASAGQMGPHLPLLHVSNWGVSRVDRLEILISLQRRHSSCFEFWNVCIWHFSSS